MDRDDAFCVVNIGRGLAQTACRWNAPGFVSLFRDEVLEVLRWQGLGSDPCVGVIGIDPERMNLDHIVPIGLMRLESTSDAVRLVRSTRHVAIVASFDAAAAIAGVLGPDAIEMVGLIGIAPQPATSRPDGVMVVLHDATPDELEREIRRALELRALYSLELLHRCEVKRIARREHELIGEPPETLSDDLDMCHPPPLPVGAASSYDLEGLANAFEQAYVERVQVLADSVKDAAERLDVSSATLTRRRKRE